MLVEGWYDAIAAGDGESACSALTERGQRLIHRVVTEVSPEVGEHATDCATAVAGFWDSLTEDQQRRALASILPVALDEVHVEERRQRAQVACEFRGAMFLERTANDGWLIDVPACVD